MWLSTIKRGSRKCSNILLNFSAFFLVHRIIEETLRLPESGFHNILSRKRNVLFDISETFKTPSLSKP